MTCKVQGIQSDMWGGEVECPNNVRVILNSPFNYLRKEDESAKVVRNQRP